jgi:hypothetical protein
LSRSLSREVLVELYWLLAPEVDVPAVLLPGEGAELDELLELYGLAEDVLGEVLEVEEGELLEL